MTTRVDRAPAASFGTPRANYDVADQTQFRRSVEEKINFLGNRAITSMPWLDVTTGLYRARGDGITDDGLAIQAAIDAQAATVAPTADDETVGGGVVYMPSGHYLVKSLTLRYGVALVGSGQQSTKLLPLDTTTHAVVTLDEGIVAYSAMMGFSLIGTGATGQRGIYLKAQPIKQGGTTQGGFWNSVLSNITITGFAAESLWLHGGGDTFDGPHQFVTIDQVECVSASTTTATLRLSGECNQIRFLGPCRFDGPGKGAGTVNVLIERTVDDSGVNNGNVAPLTVDFGLTTIQSNTRGVTIETAQGVWFSGTHFEELDEGIYVDLGAPAVTVDRCYAGNVGYKGDGSGYFLKVNSGSAVAQNNRFASSSDPVATEKHYVRTGGYLAMRGIHSDSTGIRTSGITLQIDTAATIDVTGFDTVLINGGSATAVQTITSDMPVGGVLCLRAHTDPVIFQSGGNITFDASIYTSPLTIPGDCILTLVRVDLGGTWFIIGGPGNGPSVASVATSKAESASIRASVADSKAVSAGSQATSASTRAGVADSKAVSAGSLAATAESDAQAASAAASDADSRLTSAGF